MSEKKLTKQDINALFVRSNAVQSAFSFERQQAMGFEYAMIPIINKLYDKEEDRIAAYQRHLTYFNSHPWTCGVIFGIVIINIAARKGKISSFAGMDNFTENEKKGFVPVSERKTLVTNVTTNDVINPVAFHMAIIAAIMFVAYIFLDQIKKIPFFAQTSR